MTVWTIGHGTRPAEEFVQMLRDQGVRTLVDVRRFPGSRHNAQFNQTALATTLAEAEITYRHAVELGGRLSGEPGEERFGCLRVAAFRSYAARMGTERWQEALAAAGAEPMPCLMCSETLWWRCHRRLIAELLHTRGQHVVHLSSVVAFVRACRELVGESLDLLVDVGYRWQDAKSAILTVREMEEHGVYLLEAALHTDNLRGHAALARATTVRLAVGEMLSTRYEFLDYMNVGLVDVVQPNVGRVGGLTEAVRVGRLAHDRGILCIPHAWKSGISIAANLHLAAVLPNAPYFEFMVTSNLSDLRRQLVTPEFELVDGKIMLPEEPGLGVEIDERALASLAA